MKHIAKAYEYRTKSEGYIHAKKAASAFFTDKGILAKKCSDRCELTNVLRHRNNKARVNTDLK